MKQDNKDNNRSVLAMILLWAVILTIVFVTLSSCKEIQYVTVPEVHTEYVTKELRDTAYQHDSIYIKEVQKGDTVRITEYRYKDRFRYVYSTDTIIQRDTISVVHTEVVEKSVAKMNSLQSAFFWLGMLTFICAIGYVAYRYIRRRFRS